jgi:hypothetical protein
MFNLLSIAYVLESDAFYYYSSRPACWLNGVKGPHPRRIHDDLCWK